MTLIDVKQTGMNASAAARVAEFAASDVFRRLFAEGMALVEETAAYLDGPGRDDAKRLGRAGALAYASESMRLTTRLMQCASWLLAQRAVREGEISPAEATAEKYRLTGAARPDDDVWPEGEDPCPARLKDLVVRSAALHGRLARLDGDLAQSDAPDAGAHPLAGQWSALEDAFGGR